MKQPEAIFTLALGAAAAVGATTTDVTLMDRKTVPVAGETLVAAVEAESAEYPADLGATPIFWLDCTQTNGWEIAADGKVSKATSRVGERYLTSTYAYNRPFKNWSSPNQMKPPKFVEDDELLAGGALDFGEMAGSGGLVFDEWKPADAPDGCALSNVLEGVTTVVAVYGSQNGGGFLLGGGLYGYRWHRGGNPLLEPYLGTTDVLWHWNPVFNTSHAPEALRAGWFWHDGFKTDPCGIGFNGGWEVVATEPSAAVGYPANGVGINDTRGSMWRRSGGMKIAELLLFDVALTDAQLKKLDLYLDAKWLGRTRRGRDGRAVLGRFDVTQSNPKGDGDVIVAAVDVPAGRSLEIGELRGGRASHGVASFVKNGEGTLKAGDLSRYSGTVKLAGGTLAFPEQRTIPTADALPTNLFARFDASLASSLDVEEVGGETLVNNWHSPLARKFNGCEVRLFAESESHRPALVSEQIGGAAHSVLDFGRYDSAGSFLAFTTNTVSATPNVIEAPQVVTVAYAIAPYDASGTVLDGFFTRGGSNWRTTLLTATPRTLQTYNSSNLSWSGNDAIVRVNGVAQNGVTYGYNHLGWQVVLVQLLADGNVTRIGKESSSAKVFGGFRLGEVLMWNRVLTEREMEDAEAYLAKKWLGSSLPGHERADANDATPDVQDVVVTGEATIDVPAGAVARVGKIATPGKLTKTGGGTLVIQSSPSGGESAIAVKGGEVRWANPPDPGDYISALAANPSLHLDASAVGTIDVIEVNGTNFVRTWRSDAGGNAAFDSDTSCRPWLNSEDSLNGKPVVDFGKLGATYGKWLALSKSLNGVRSAFVVWGAQNGGGFLLGSNSANNDSLNQNMYDFHRGTEPSGSTCGYDSQLFYPNGPNNMTYNGEIFTNGVPVTYDIVPAHDWQLVEVYTKDGGAHVSALARDRSVSGRSGGQRLAEVVLYERPLTERERVATRNYLMQKWFNREPDAAAFPALTNVVAATALSAIGAEEGETTTLDADGDVSVERLEGVGTVEKTGAGVLTVKDLDGFGGTVRVEEGALKLVGAVPTAEGALVEEGRIFHADATYGLVTSTNSAGEVTVTEWKSRHDETWSVKPPITSSPPDLMPFGLNGLPAVDMKSGTGQYLRFYNNGAWRFVGNVHSIFWVIGSQNGGGYLMGGGTNWHNGVQYPWHRGFDKDKHVGNGAGLHACPLLNSSHSVEELRTKASWWIGGEKVDPIKAGLSGGWDYMTMTVPDADVGNRLNAQGFAFDGRAADSSSSSSSTGTRGHQRLAEVIIYDRELSEAERLSNEAYLARKWGFVHQSATNAAAVVLAGGALDCGGETQFVESICGAGAVTNGNLSAAKLVADRNAVGVPALTGAFAFPRSVEVELKNLPAKLKGVTIPVLSAASVAGMGEAAVVFTGDACSEFATPYLKFADGELKVAFKISGLAVIVR